MLWEREREAVRARMSEFSSLVEPPSASRIDPISTPLYVPWEEEKEVVLRI